MATVTNPTPTTPLRPRQWVVTALVALAMLAVQYLTRVPAPTPPVVTTPAVTKTEPAPRPAPPPAVAPDPEIRRLASDYYRLYPAGYATARGATTTPYDRVMSGLAELRTAARDALAAAIDARVKPLVNADGNYADPGKAAGVFAVVEASLKAGLKDAADQ